jgi:protein-disulfide isomerase
VKNKDLAYNVAAVVLTLCGLILTSIVVRREFFPASPQGDPREIEGWEQLAAQGSILGAEGAPLRIVEFSDFQCPYCADVQKDLDRLRAEYPDKVAIVYRHLPLTSIHPHAFMAALAAECAGAQGKFESFHDLLFGQQDSIGRVPWDELAAAAGIPNVGEFQECLGKRRFKGRIGRDLAAADEAGVRATPTFIFNGRVVSGANAVDHLRRWIAETRNGA